MEFMGNRKPTDPDERDSRIRFLGSNPFTGLETNQVKYRLAYNYATHHTYCSNIDTGYELRVSPVEPYSKRYTRPPLPYSGSLGPRFPTLSLEHIAPTSVILSAKTSECPSQVRSLFAILT